MTPLVAHVVDLETHTQEHFAFLRSPVRIGRSELNDLTLTRKFVSTYHGLIHFNDAQERYVDLGSTNGSTVNGARLQKNAQRVLAPGDVLSIGTYQITFERGAVEERPVTNRATVFAARAATIGGGTVDTPAGAGSTPPGEEALPDLEAGGEDSTELDEAFAAVALDLDLGYASYRGAWEHLRGALEKLLGGLKPGVRAAAVRRLCGQYAALGQEPEFGALAGVGPASPPANEVAQAAPAGRPAAGALGDDALQLLRAFADSYLAGRAGLGTRKDVEAVLARTASALETYSRSFVELRRGYEEFGREVGVRTVQAEGVLGRARDATQILHYLLDPGAQGRDAELQRVFADFMIHQVALLRGVVDGARAVLAQISPESISGVAPTSRWPLRAAGLWRTFEQRYHELADDESSLTEVLFGREFALAYAALAGHAPGDAAPAAREAPARVGLGD